MTPWEDLKRRMKEQNKGGGSSEEDTGSSGKSGSGTRTPWQDYKQRMEGRKKEADFFSVMEREREPVKLPKLSYPKPLSAPSGEGYFSYPGEQIQKDRAQLSDLYQADNDRFLSGVKGTVAPYYIGAMEEHRASQPLYQSKGYPGLTAKPEPVTDLEAHIEPTEDYYAAAIEYAKNVHPYAERAGKTAQAAQDYEESVVEVNEAWKSRLRTPEEVQKELDALPDENFVGPTKQGLLEEELSTSLYLAYEDSYKSGNYDLVGLSKSVGSEAKRISELEQEIREDRYTLDNWAGDNWDWLTDEGRAEAKIISDRIAANEKELKPLQDAYTSESEAYSYYLGRIFQDMQTDSALETTIATGKQKHETALKSFDEYMKDPENQENLGTYHQQAPTVDEGRREYPLAVSIEDLSEEDRDKFWYLIGKGYDEIALDYANRVVYSDRKERLESIENWAGKNFGTGAVATAGSLLTLPVSWMDPMIAANKTANTGLQYSNVGPGSFRDSLKSGVAESLNEFSGTIPENIPVVGGKGLGDLYQLGMSMAESYISGVIAGPVGASIMLGGSAFASGYNQAMSKGVDHNTALKYGAAQGLAEVIFEYVSLDKLFSESGGGFLKNVLSQGGVEASEEACTSVANFFTDRWIMGGKSEYELSVKAYMDDGMTEEEARKKATWDFVENTAADALGGFISGGGMSAANSAVNKIMTSQQNQINRAHELLGKVDERTDAYTISRALHTVGVSMTEDNRLATMEELIDRGMGREDAQQISTAMEKAVNGKRLTSGEKKLLQQDSHLGEMLRTNLQRESAVGENLVANSVPTAEKSAKSAQPSLPDNAPKATTVKITGVDETNSPKLSEDAGARVGKVTQAAFEPTADGKTHLAEGGEAVTIRGVAKVETGKERNQVYLEVVDEDGHKSVVPGDSLDYGSRDEMLLYEGFGQLGISAKYFPEFLAGFRHQQEMGKDTGTDLSIGEYALYFEEAVFYGRHNMEAALARSALLQDARNTAYAAGQDSRSQIKKQSNQQEAAVATAKKSGQGKVHKKGQVHYSDNMPLKLSKFQKAGVKVAEKLASFGLEVHVYRSTLNAQGQWINDRGEASPNGYYVLEDGSIHVDLNAGAGGRGLVVYTLAHEITHFMARHNRAGFETLADLLVEWYEGKNVKVEDLIRERMEEHGYSREVAFEEVVAHSCESFLTDSDILVKLTDLKQKHSKIYNQIRETVLKFVEWMRKLFRDIDPDSQEGRMLHEARGTIDHIYEAFTSGMSGAIDTYQWIGAQKNTTDEGGVLYSYAGRNARTADHEALQKAQQMLEDGSTMEDIRRETGWHQGFDGKWRFEIDDSRMQYYRNGDARFGEMHPEYAEYQDLSTKFIYGTITEQEVDRLRELGSVWGNERGRLSNRISGGSAKLSDILSHDALYEAYPELADVSISFGETNGREKGYFDKRKNTIVISNVLRNSPESTLLHEIQHAIQDIEGFASGASPEYWEDRLRSEAQREIEEADQRYRELWEALPEEAKSTIREINRAKLQKDWDRVLKLEDALYESEYADLYSELSDADFDRRNLREREQDFAGKAMERYRNTAGEIEARDSASRRTLTLEERKKTSPKYGDDNTVFAEAKAGYFALSIEEEDTIRKQLLAHSKELNAMEVVGRVNTQEYFGLGTNQVFRKLVDELKKTGYKVDRKDFGVIEFSQGLINTSLNYKDNNASVENARRLGFLVLSNVLKRGIVIDGHVNHKGRNYDTVTIGAPVEINGKRGNMAVIVRFTKGNRYKVHRILSPDGSKFSVEKMTNAEVNTAETFTNGSQSLRGSASTINSASMDSIHDISKKSNTQSEEKSTNIYSKRSGSTLQESLMAMEPALVENRGEQKLLERYQADSKKRSAEVQRQQKMEAELAQLEASETPNESKIKALKERLIRSYNLTEALDQRMIAAEARLKSLAEGKGRLGKTANADLLTMSPEALRDRVAQVEQQLADSYGRQDELTQQRDHAKAQSHRSTGTRINRKGLFTFVKDLMRKNGAESLATDRVKAKTDELGVIFDKAAEIYDRLGAKAADTYLLLSVESFTRDLTDSGTLVTDTAAMDIMAEAKRLMEGSRMQTVMDRVTARYEELLQQKDQRLEEQKRKARENEEKIVTKYQEARTKSVDSRKKTAIKSKIRKSLKELNSLLTHGNKKKNVKNGMQDVAASLLAYGDVLFSHESQIAPETMVRNGIMTDLTDAESDALNKYADLLQKRDDYEKRIAAVRQYRRGDWVTKEKDLQEMVDFVNGKLAKATKDLSSVFERERARMNKVTFSAILSELTASYKALENAQDEYIRGAYISYVYDRLVAIKDQGTPVKDMSLAQLTELHDAVKMVMTTVKNANRLFREGKAETLSQMVDRVQTEIRALYRKEADPKAVAGKVKQFVRSFVWNELKPYYAFDRIGSEGLMELFWDVIKAEGNYGLEISEAGAFVENLRKEHGYKDWDMDTVTVIKTDDDMDFKVTLGDMMSIYAYSRRDQAFKHMTSGGFVFNPGQEYKDGEKKLFGKRMRSTEIETYRMTEDLLLEIINTLTPEQRAYAEAMQDYLTRLGEKGNEVSRQMYGIDLFKEKFYFPLKSSADFRSSAEQQLGATPTTASLVNTGMTKETVPDASNPIVLERFDDVAIRHIDQMLKYHNYVLPIENMRKVMDYTQLTDGEWDTSVKRLIKAVYGQEANAYLEQWITDLNGGASESGAQNPLAQFFARSKKVSVAGNLSVVVQQYFAVTRAAAEIDPKYFVPLKGSDASKSEQRQWDELKQWAGLAVIKEMGGFDMGSARTAQDYLGKTETKTNLIEKTDNAMMWGASKMDEIGWSSIWRAVKKEVADKQGLQPGTEEFFKAAGQRFTEVVVKTQVYDSVTARSGFMRSKRDSVKYLVSFLGEPTTIVNMMFSAQVQLYRAQRSGDAAAMKQARGRIGRTSAVLILSSVLGSLAKSLVYAMRDDEETEAFLERYWKQFGMALRSDMNPLNMIPIGRDIMSLLDGWDIERPDMGLLNDFITALKRAIKGDKPMENWTNFTMTVFNLIGVPVKNVVRDGKAFVRLYGDITDDIKPEESGASFYRGLAGKDRSKDEILYEAVVNGNAGKVQQIRREYADNGKYTTALRKALRTCDPRIREAALARYEGDITGYMNIAKEILAEGYFVQDDIVSAIMTDVSNIKTEREGKAPSQPSTPAMYTGEDYMASVLDEPETAEAVREYIIDRYKSKGKSQAEAESAFYSDIRSEIKGEYDMGTVDYGTAFDYLTDFGGYSENDAYWALDKWDYSQENGGTEGYSKYNDFFSAVETGEGLADMIDLYESKGVEAKDMASQITSHFKPIYIAMSAAERRELKKKLVKAYSALGYDRSDAIDKWLKN